MPDKVTDADIDRVREYCEKATEEPWYSVNVFNKPMCVIHNPKLRKQIAGGMLEQDADFAADARTDLPRAIATIAHYKRRAEEAEAAFRELASYGGVGGYNMDEFRLEAFVDKIRYLIDEGAKRLLKIAELEAEIARLRREFVEPVWKETP